MVIWVQGGIFITLGRNYKISKPLGTLLIYIKIHVCICNYVCIYTYIYKDTDWKMIDIHRCMQKKWLLLLL